MASSGTEEIFRTALSEVNNLFALVSALPENQQEAILQEMRQRISGFDLEAGQRSANGSDPKTNEKQCQKTRTSLRQKKLPEKLQDLRTTSKSTVERKKLTQPKVTKENGGALTIKPCFLRLVPLSRSQTEAVSKETFRKRYTRPDPEDIIQTEDEEDIDDPDFCEGSCSGDDDFQPVMRSQRTTKRKKRKVQKLQNHTSKNEKLYMCEKCGKSFSQKTGLDIHLKRHEGVKSFACSLCDYHAVCKIEILRHMSKHTGERKHPCKFCDKLFTSDCSLRNHVRHVHLRQDRVGCNQCSFQTHSKDILRKHYLIKHTCKEEFECPVCHEVVKQKGSFMVHLRKHTGEKPYHCSVCSKSFKSSSQLAAHSRTHRPGEYSCSHCARNFKTKHHLDRHRIIHTGEKPFVCHLCTYACNVKANITKHIRTVHKVHSFSFKEPYPTSNGPDDNPDALKRGNRAADEYLKEHTLNAGEILTLDDLRRQSLEQRESQQEAKLEELRQRDAAYTASTTAAPPTEDGGRVENQPESVNVQVAPVVSSLVDTCTSDILSDAVQLLNSPDQEACPDEGSGEYKTVGETVNIPIEIDSNMYLIQVVSDQNITF